MASTTVVKVTVEELTKYGFKANGRYVNYSKQLSETDKTKVVPGASFEAEYYVADSGKEYLNKIVNTRASQTPPVAVVAEALAKAVDTERAKKFTPKFTKKEEAVSNSMSKADWAAKDRNMMIGGRSHDAAVIVAAMVNVSSLDVSGALETYKTILDGMLKIAEEVK